MRLLVFGGTTEGRILARELSNFGHAVTVSVATELGREELSSIPGVRVLVGRRNQEAMEVLLPGYDLCIDATHPYAREATAAIEGACKAVNIPYLRLKRPESPVEDAVCVENAKEAAAYLGEHPGNVLLTTGAKELPDFAALEPERLYARVLPTHQGIAACEALGLSHRNILALQGPFTRALNEAILEQYHIRYLVTKDGGGPGGFREKLEAARNQGVQVLLIGRPREEGLSLEEMIKRVKEWKS